MFDTAEGGFKVVVSRDRSAVPKAEAFAASLATSSSSSYEYERAEMATVPDSFLCPITSQIMADRARPHLPRFFPSLLFAHFFSSRRGARSRLDRRRLLLRARSDR